MIKSAILNTSKLAILLVLFLSSITLVGPINTEAAGTCLTTAQLYNNTAFSGVSPVEALRSPSIYGNQVKEIVIVPGVIFLDVSCNLLKEKAAIAEIRKSFQSPIVGSLRRKYNSQVSRAPIYIIPADTVGAFAVNYIYTSNQGTSSVIAYNTKTDFSNASINWSTTYNEVGDLANRFSVTPTRQYQSSTFAVSNVMQSLTGFIPNYRTSAPAQRQALFTQYAIFNKAPVIVNYTRAYNFGMTSGYSTVPLAANPNAVVKEMNRQFKLMGLSGTFTFVNVNNNIVLR